MALSPKQVQIAQEAMIAEEINKLEEIIDEALIRGRRHFDVKLRRRFVIDVLKTRYEKAGWNVQLVNDQREGHYLSFSGKVNDVHS